MCSYLNPSLPLIKDKVFTCNKKFDNDFWINLDNNVQYKQVENIIKIHYQGDIREIKFLGPFYRFIHRKAANLRAFAARKWLTLCGKKTNEKREEPWKRMLKGRKNSKHFTGKNYRLHYFMKCTTEVFWCICWIVHADSNMWAAHKDSSKYELGKILVI